ncbi:hypothetical protein CK203_013664 [Vitis vinifera]|uniref:Uncharacterized protein n=1 Tax=Vitis vinifera TaxID=29760 RepID=A0A438J8S9_VITVI|nr:hypothetical protein CK203_013664 [Vitis vinifera]
MSDEIIAATLTACMRCCLGQLRDGKEVMVPSAPVLPISATIVAYGMEDPWRELEVTKQLRNETIAAFISRAKFDVEEGIIMGLWTETTASSSNPKGKKVVDSINWKGELGVIGA